MAAIALTQMSVADFYSEWSPRLVKGLSSTSYIVFFSWFIFSLMFAYVCEYVHISVGAFRSQKRA